MDIIQKSYMPGNADSDNSVQDNFRKNATMQKVLRKKLMNKTEHEPSS